MALASLADLKSYLMASSDADDALLSRLISASSDWFEGQTGQTFATSSYTDVRSGDGGTALVLIHGPVISVTAVTVDGETIPESTSSAEPGHFLMDGLVRLRGGHVFHRGVGNVGLTYVAGYDPIPQSVQQAVIEWAALLYQQRRRIGLVGQSNPAGESFSYQALSVPIGVSTVVEAYRRLPRTL